MSLNGFGRKEFPNKAIYEGNFKNGLREGKGKTTYSPSNGNFYVLYEGDFHKDEKSGTGKMIFQDGAVYVGDWKNGKREGRGRMMYPQTSPYKLYEGEYHDNGKSGWGKMTYWNGFYYEGSWRNNYERVLVGFSGISTTGKSTLATALLSHFPDAQLFKVDDYFLSPDTFPTIRYNGQSIPNWEDPSTLDWRRLLRDIDASSARLIFVDSFVLFANSQLAQQLSAAVIVRYQHNAHDRDVAAARRAVRGASQDWYKEVVWKQAWDPARQWMWDGSRARLRTGAVLNLAATDDQGRNKQRAKEFIAKLLPPTFKKN